jgi:hypothetical protein
LQEASSSSVKGDKELSKSTEKKKLSFDKEVSQASPIRTVRRKKVSTVQEVEEPPQPPQQPKGHKKSSTTVVKFKRNSLQTETVTAWGVVLKPIPREGLLHRKSRLEDGNFGMEELKFREMEMAEVNLKDYEGKVEEDETEKRQLKMRAFQSKDKGEEIKSEEKEVC